jgi:hypothetical protein
VNPNEQRYTAVAIVLHWAIAAAHYVARPDLGDAIRICTHGNYLIVGSY